MTTCKQTHKPNTKPSQVTKYRGFRVGGIRKLNLRQYWLWYHIFSADVK
jgi:hypothetical protein